MAISGEERGPAEAGGQHSRRPESGPSTGDNHLPGPDPLPLHGPSLWFSGTASPPLGSVSYAALRPRPLRASAPSLGHVTVDRTSVPRPLSRVCVPEKRPGGGTGSTRSEAGPGPISYLSCPTPLGSVHPVTRGVTGDPRKVASRRAMACAYPTGAHRMLFSSSTPGLSCASR